MHSRHRSPGNGYRSGPVGMGGGAAPPSRITPENLMRGHGMFNAEYRGYNNHGFGRGQPSPRPTTQVSPPPPPQQRRPDIFAEAGRLATEYLVSQGVLPQNVFSGKWQNGNLKNLMADLRTKSGGSGLGPERRRSPKENDPNGLKNNSQEKRRTEFSKNNGSDSSREMGRSSSISEKARPVLDAEEQGVFVNEAGMVGKSISISRELGPASDISAEPQPEADDVINKDDIKFKSDVMETKTSEDVKPLDEKTDDMKDGTDICVVEKLSETGDVANLDCAAKDDSINEGGNDLSSSWRFAIVPTKTRSSLTTRSQKDDEVSITEEEKGLEVSQRDGCIDGTLAGSEVIFNDVSVESSMTLTEIPNQIQDPNCVSSDGLNPTPGISLGNAGGLELESMEIALEKCTRSQSLPHRSLMDEQEPSEGHLGFGLGRCSSMVMRGEKRTMDYDDDKKEIKKIRELDSAGVTRTNDYFHLYQTIEGKDNAEPCSEFTKEKQLLPSSFKICDHNLLEASKVNENSVSNPIALLPSVTESKSEALAPVVIDLSTNNKCGISNSYSRLGVDGREIEVIDLDNDSLQDDNAFKSFEKKEDAVFMGSESFPNHVQSVNDISDVQDGYGLMMSDFLGNDIANCHDIPANINSLPNDMTLHNGEGILGDDESIYMSLGEIPISYLNVWEQSTQDYDNKPF